MWLVLIVIPQCQHPFLLRSAVRCAVVRSNQPGVLQQLRARCFPKAGHKQRQSVPQQAERHHKHTQTDRDTHTDTHSRDCVNTRKFSARTPRPGSSLGVYTRGAPSGAPPGCSRLRPGPRPPVPCPPVPPAPPAPTSAARQRRPRARLRAQAGGRPLPAAGTGDSGLGARPPLLPQPRSAPPARPAGPGSPPAGPDRAGPGPLRRPLPPPPAGPSWAPRGYLLTAEPGRRRRRREGPRERWEL